MRMSGEIHLVTLTRGDWQQLFWPLHSLTADLASPHLATIILGRSQAHLIRELLMLIKFGLVPIR